MEGRDGRERGSEEKQEGREAESVRARERERVFFVCFCLVFEGLGSSSLEGCLQELTSV